MLCTVCEGERHRCSGTAQGDVWGTCRYHQQAGTQLSAAAASSKRHTGTRAHGAAELCSESTEREKAKGFFKKLRALVTCTAAESTSAPAAAPPKGHGQGQGRCRVMGMVMQGRVGAAPVPCSLHPPAVSPGLQVECSSASTGWDVSMQEGTLCQGEGPLYPFSFPPILSLPPPQPAPQ